MDIFLLKLLCLTTISGLIKGDCLLPGYCDLNHRLYDVRTYNTCNIPADTICSSAICNHQGTCFMDQGDPKPYCNCSGTTYGEFCQYTLTESSNCTTDNDCAGLSRGSCVTSNQTGGTCQCKTGYRGPHCQLETRVFVNDSGICNNNGWAYKQGDKIGCYCKCGYLGTYCSELSPEVINNENCDYVICNGHGKCKLSENNTVVCDCTHAYKGQFCEIYWRHTTPTLITTPKYTTTTSTTTKTTTTLTPVDPNSCTDSGYRKCQNAGACKIVFINGSFTTRCVCSCGYFGVFCEVSKNHHNFCEIMNHKCFNGGSCDVVNCDIVCVCTPGFTGPYCQTPVDDVTTPEPEAYCDGFTGCLNGGTCVNGFCECPPGFSGLLCDRRSGTEPGHNVCSSVNPCRNSGWCSNGTCKCSCGFFGPYCQYSTDKTRTDYRDWCRYDNYQCQHGGTCYFNKGRCKVECACQTDYYGDHCEKALFTTTTCGSWIGCSNFTCPNRHTCVVDKCGKPHCQYASSSTTEDRVYTGYYLPVVLLGIVCFVVIMAVVLYRMRKNRRRIIEEERRSAALPSAPYATVTFHQTINFPQVSIEPEVVEPPPALPPVDELPTYEEACQKPPSYSDVLNSYI